MAELDLDPHNKARVVVCSLHFRDGRPTRENPFPTELLGEVGREAPVYRGRRPEEEQGETGSRAAGEALEAVMAAVNARIEGIEQRREEEAARERERDEARRREVAAHRNVRYHQLCPRGRRKRQPAGVVAAGVRKRPRPRGRLKAGLVCRVCKAGFGFTRALYHHVTRVHCRAARELQFSGEERAAALATLYPREHTVRRLDPKKKYVCAVCKSVCDLLGLFVHMKQVHHGLLCQYCLKLFKKVGDLEHHLAAAHRLPTRYYSSFGQMTGASGGQVTLACGECSVLLSREQAEVHECSTRRQWECPHCRQVEASQEQVELHLVRCPRLPGGPGLPRHQAVRHVVLTGNTRVSVSDCELLPPPPPEPRAAAAPSRPPPSAPTRRPVFSCSDRNVLVKYSAGEAVRVARPAMEELPPSGTIFWGSKSRGISNHVKKEFKDLGTYLDLAKELERTDGEARQVEQGILAMRIEKAGRNFIVSLPRSEVTEEEEEEGEAEEEEMMEEPVAPAVTEESPERRVVEEPLKVETKQERVERLEEEVAAGMVELRAAVDREGDCLFCQQCRTVVVEATFLLSHLVVAHQVLPVSSKLIWDKSSK